MSRAVCEIVALAGFILAGLIYTAVGLRDGDALVIAGSLVWTLACLIWLFPHLRGDAS